MCGSGEEERNISGSQTDDDLELSQEESEPEMEVEKLHVRRRVVGRRLDKYLHGRYPRLSRTLVQKLIKQGEITVNGKKSKCSYEPASNDVIELRVPPPEPTDIIPEDIPIDIVYEDKHMMAINKHTGIICHPSHHTQMGTVANALTYYAGENLSHGDDPFRPGIVHRLDKNTSGIMLIAKSDEAHWRLSLQFERREVQKTYFAILEGNPTLDGDMIDQPLAAHPAIKERHCVPGFPTRQMLFKDAVTLYEVQERFVGFSTVHMWPKTGRTHQLRVHMSAIGHPMLGDTLYGGHLMSERDITHEESASTEPVISHQSLHAFQIEFKHPITEKPMKLEAPISPLIQNITNMIRKYRSR